MASIFGTTVYAGQIERAVLTTLKTWLHPTYINAAERDLGRPVGDLPAPREWRIVNELEAPLGPKQTPAVWLVSAGLDGEPELHDDSYSAAWLVSVAVIVSARSHELTVELARIYAGAIRSVLLHKQDLDGLTIGVEWVDESYDRGPDVLGATTAFADLTFRVHVGSTVTVYAGPDDPIDSPEPEDPEAPEALTVSTEFTPTQEL